MARKHGPQWFDSMYNNRAPVPEHASHLAQWTERSARVRATQSCELDVKYGEEAGESLDIFPAATAHSSANAPVLVFIQGGYWRSLDKADQSVVAPCA